MASILKIQDNGKILLEGAVFDSYSKHFFEACIDTGCTDNLVIDRLLADAVCAQEVREEKRSIGAGSGEVSGLIRKVNLSFGDLEVCDLEVYVPNSPISRNLIGISFLQKIGAFLMIDFKSGRTQGGLLTTDRSIPYIVGKASHIYCCHQSWVVSQMPCEICGLESAEIR